MHFEFENNNVMFNYFLCLFRKLQMNLRVIFHFSSNFQLKSFSLRIFYVPGDCLSILLPRDFCRQCGGLDAFGLFRGPAVCPGYSFQLPYWISGGWRSPNRAHETTSTLHKFDTVLRGLFVFIAPGLPLLIPWL